MSYTIYLTASAIADIMMAKEYYESKSVGLGKRMAGEVDVMLFKVGDMPLAYSIRYREIRAAKVPSFPYLIYYKINERNRTIEVLRVFNTHQKPFWKQR